MKAEVLLYCSIKLQNGGNADTSNEKEIRQSPEAYAWTRQGDESDANWSNAAPASACGTARTLVRETPVLIPPPYNICLVEASGNSENKPLRFGA
jgi:hypothetical protein